MAEEEEVEVPSLKGEPARNESFGLFFFCILVICCHIWTYRDPCASRLLPWGFVLGETPHFRNHAVILLDTLAFSLVHTCN